jgi:hypothetical protein
LLIIVVAAVTLLLSAGVSIILNNNNFITLPSIGNIHTINLKAYWDPNLQNEAKNITWGTVYAGQTYNVTLYLQSTSNVRTVLNMTTNNWNFTTANGTPVNAPANLSQCINMTLNCSIEPLNPKEVTQATLTLTTADSWYFITYLINNNVTRVTMDVTIQANET